MWQEDESPAPAPESGESMSGLRSRCNDALENDREMRLVLVGAMREQNEMIGVLDEDLSRVVEHANADSAVQSCSLAYVMHLHEMIARFEQRQSEHEHRTREMQRQNEEEFREKIDRVVSAFESRNERCEKRLEEINSICEKMIEQHADDLKNLSKIDKAHKEHSQAICTIHEKLDNFSEELYIGTDQVVVDDEGDVSLTQTLEKLSDECRTVKRGLDVQRRTTATHANILESKASQDVEAVALRNEKSIAELQQFVEDNVDVDLMDVRRKQDQLLAAVEDYQADLDTRPTDEAVDQKIMKKYDSLLSQLHRALASVKDDDSQFKDCIESLQTKTVEIQRQTIADFKVSTTHMRGLEERIRQLEARDFPSTPHRYQPPPRRTLNSATPISAEVERQQQPGESSDALPLEQTKATRRAAESYQQPDVSRELLPADKPSNVTAVSYTDVNRQENPISVNTTTGSPVASNPSRGLKVSPQEQNRPLQKLHKPSKELHKPMHELNKPTEVLSKPSVEDASNNASGGKIAASKQDKTNFTKPRPNNATTAVSTAVEETVSQKEPSLAAHEDNEHSPAPVRTQKPIVRQEILDKGAQQQETPHERQPTDGIEQKFSSLQETRVLEEGRQDVEEARQEQRVEILPQVEAESLPAIQEARVSHPLSAQQVDVECVDIVVVPEERAPPQQKQLETERFPAANTDALPVSSSETGPPHLEEKKQHSPLYEPKAFLSLLSEKLDKTAAEAMIASAISRLSISVKAHLDQLMSGLQQEQQQQHPPQRRGMPPLKKQYKPLPSIVKQRQQPGAQPIKIPAPEPVAQGALEIGQEGAEFFTFSLDDNQSSTEKRRPETVPLSPQQQQQQYQSRRENREVTASKEWRRDGGFQSPLRGQERRGGEDDENVFLLSNRFRCLSCKAPCERISSSSSSFQQENGILRSLGAGFKAREMRPLSSSGIPGGVP